MTGKFFPQAADMCRSSLFVGVERPNTTGVGGHCLPRRCNRKGGLGPSRCRPTVAAHANR